MTNRQRSFFIPVVERRGEFNVGLAALKALLLGYGLPADEQQLVTAFKADSGEPTPARLAPIATQFGLAVEEKLLPVDHLWALEARHLPLLVLMRPMPEEPGRAVVIWNRVGPLWQVMDPIWGVRWVTRQTLWEELERTPATITVEQWRTLATSPEFRTDLEARLLALEIPLATVTALLDKALTAAEWYPLAALDAATRMVTKLVAAEGFQPGEEAGQALLHCWELAQQELPGASQTIPDRHWLATPATLTGLRARPTSTDLSGLQNLTDLEEPITLLQFRGVETLCVQGRRELDPVAAETPASTPASSPQAARSLWQFIQEEGPLSPAVVLIATIFAGAGLFVQAILFRSLAELSLTLTTLEQRLWTIGLLLLFGLALLALEWVSQLIMVGLGFRLDGRLRLAMVSMLPQLSYQAFFHFSAGDITKRLHNIRTVSYMPFYGRMLIISFTQFVLTVVGLAWIDWLSAVLAIARLVVSYFAMRTTALLQASRWRLYTYEGILSRFYLDAMLGLVAVRTHGAERATRREFESLLVKWGRSNVTVAKGQSWIETFDAILSNLLIALIILLYVWRKDDPTNLLLVSYWSMNLSSLGQQSIGMFFMFIFEQSKAQRFLELLDAPKEPDLALKREAAELRGGEVAEPDDSRQMTEGIGQVTVVDEATGERASRPHNSATSRPYDSAPSPPYGLEIAFQDVSVQIAGQVVLRDVNLTIAAGSQIAIVGPSGAGKSTLMGLLLGWHFSKTGEIRVDGELFDYAALLRLRRNLAWVDPAIQLWNRSFIDNLRYTGEDVPLNWVIDQADLQGVLERLPVGMQTQLGGEGRLVSGGEGQRVRFGRSLQRPGARLVILDEPFRGLDREKRRLLLSRARSFWPHATLVCVTHDVGETLGFERVLVVDQGRVIEDDVPERLAAQPNSRYRALLDAEEAVREKLWSSDEWRRLWMEQGQVREVGRQ